MPADPNHVLTASEAEAILVDQYRKKLKNVALYYSGRKLSELDKDYGITPGWRAAEEAGPGRLADTSVRAMQ